MNLPNSLLIELPVGSTAQLSFGDQPILRGKKLLTVLPTPASSPTGAAVYALDGRQLVNLLAGATLTLKTGNSHDVHANLPLRYLYEAAAAGHPLLFGQDIIDWSKSYITIPPGSAGAGTVVQIAVIYQ